MSYLDPTGVCSTLSTSDPMWICSGCQAAVTNDYTSWLSNNCPLSYRQVYNQANGALQAQTYANNLLETYFAVNTAADPFAGALHQFCNNPSLNPGVCQNYLTYRMCPNLSYDQMTAEQTDWCGCFVLPSLADQELYGSNIACYPLCHLTDTIQVVDQDGHPLQCNNQVCVIDGVSISVAESKVGNVNFNTICPGCTGNCSCIINDVNVTGVNVNINQYCGPNTSCYTTRDGVVVEVPCTVGSWLNIRLGVLILIIIVVIIAMIIILIAVYQAFKRG